MPCSISTRELSILIDVGQNPWLHRQHHWFANEFFLTDSLKSLWESLCVTSFLHWNEVLSLTLEWWLEGLEGQKEEGFSWMLYSIFIWKITIFTRCEIKDAILKWVGSTKLMYTLHWETGVCAQDIQTSCCENKKRGTKPPVAWGIVY